MPTIEDRLRQWQQELLDFSNRNTLLNFRPNTSKPSTIELIAPKPTEIYDAFRQGRSLTVLGNDPSEDEFNEEDEDERNDAHAQQEDLTGVDPRKEDELPVVREGAALASLPSERAHRVLLRLAARARGAELEQGINTLFAVFGLLKWQEPREPDRWQYAPLVMLPLRLEEITREGRFRIAASDDDPEFNQTLVERLRRDLSLDLSIDIDDETDLASVFHQVREAVSRRPGWEILEQVHLGHFQFYKLRMYEDLAEHAAVAAGHDIIQALGSDLLTIAPLPDGIPSEENLDRLVPPEQSFTILDADASQLQAVQAAIRGSHLVIQGPPGTGKSQTIANIIAECIAAGRTVLFVSEKAAAIDVVHRRLEQQGLAEFCLMLHSHKANKREIIQELGRRLDGLPPVSISAQERVSLSQLQEQRLDLDHYAEALHRTREPLQESVFWVHSQLAQLQEVPLLTVDAFSSASLTHEELDRATRLLDELALHAAVLEEGNQHPWAGAQARVLSLAERERLRGLLGSLSRQVRHLLEIGTALAQDIGLPAPTSIFELERLVDITGRLPEDRTLRACWFDFQHAEQANQLLAEGRAHAATLRELDARLIAAYAPDFFEIDPDEATASYQQGILVRLFSSKHRALRTRMRAVTKGGHNRSTEEELGALRDARSRRQYLAWFESHGAQLVQLLDLAPQMASGLDEASWEQISSEISRAAQISRILAPAAVPEAFIARAGDPRLARQIADTRRRLVAAIESYTDEMIALAHYFDDGPFPLTLAGDLSELALVLEERAARLPELDRWVRAQLALRSAEEAGLSPIVPALMLRRIPPSDWGATYRRFVLTAWLDGTLATEPVLQHFDGQRHDRRVAHFRSLDRAALKLGYRRVREAWSQKRGPVSSAYGGEPRLLQFEAQKRRRHLPLRRLFEGIPNLLPTLKPCLMMSPLSVAHYLPADRYQFDVVIFDEASQVRPHDAIGAIMRGRQLIVAGDSRQLPPTTFFDRASDDFETDDAQDIRALESILDALNAKGMPSKSLLWHYRSRHEDLIAYSNHHFYDGRLITFPSPGAERSPSLGVRLEYVEDGRYVDERDRVLKTPIRINRIEARRVAQLVMEHARVRPQESLLVVTLGMRQREVVEEEIASARQLEQDLEEFFREDKAEPFYVKALEQVQGDERDVILISIGYGKNAEGILSHNFGPINQQGGERRLNVLVTRARNQVVLVSSIRYTEIDPNKTQNLGPALLRNYLEFAERGSSALSLDDVSSDGEYESPFEEQVGEALKRAGFTVRRQVGTSKYRIDLAIVDPRDPGRFLLGIECDGRTYHQSKTARDRDRLRQELLENLGWHIHRIWSTEWIRNPEQEMERVVARVQDLLHGDSLVPQRADDINGPTANVEVETLQVSEHNEVERRGDSTQAPLSNQLGPINDLIGVLYEAADFSVPFTDLWETPLPQVMQAVVQCVEAEGPIHQELLQRRLVNLWGYQRAGSRIARQIEAATRLAVQQGRIRQDKTFLWPSNGVEVEPRGADEAGDVRQIAHIPDEEIGGALRAILERAMSLTPDELVVQAARVFGYQRTGPDIRARILAVARSLHQAGSVEFRDGRVQIGR